MVAVEDLGAGKGVVAVEDLGVAVEDLGSVAVVAEDHGRLDIQPEDLGRLDRLGAERLGEVSMPPEGRSYPSCKHPSVGCCKQKPFGKL